MDYDGDHVSHLFICPNPLISAPIYSFQSGLMLEIHSYIIQGAIYSMFENAIQYILGTADLIISQLLPSWLPQFLTSNVSLPQHLSSRSYSTHRLSFLRVGAYTQADRLDRRPHRPPQLLVFHELPAEPEIYRHVPRRPLARRHVHIHSSPFRLEAMGGAPPSRAASQHDKQFSLLLWK